MQQRAATEIDMEANSPSTPQAAPGCTGHRRFSGSRSSSICRAKPINHACLREHAFFKDRDPKLLDLLLDTIRVEVALPGQDIITEGDVGEGMYFMYHGEVEVLVGEKQVRVATLKDGSLFGEMALLGDGTRKATIRAITVCDCRVIDAKAFQICLRRFPAEKDYFMQLAKKRLAELNKTTGTKSSPCKPPSEAKQKFKRSAHLILASQKLKPEGLSTEKDCFNKSGNSVSSSRTTTCTDSLPALEDFGSTTGSRVSTMEDMLSPIPSSPRFPRSSISRTSPDPVSGSSAKTAIGQIVKGINVGSSCPNPGRRSSAPPAIGARTLDHYLDNFVPREPAAPTIRAPTSQRQGSSRLRSNRNMMPVDIKGDACDESMSFFNISRRSSKPFEDWTPSPRAPQTRRSSSSSYNRAPRMVSERRRLRAASPMPS